MVTLPDGNHRNTVYSTVCLGSAVFFVFGKKCGPNLWCVRTEEVNVELVDLVSGDVYSVQASRREILLASFKQRRSCAW